MTLRLMNQWGWKPEQRVWSSLFHYSSGMSEVFEKRWVLVGVFGFFIYIAAQYKCTL